MQLFHHPFCPSSRFIRASIYELGLEVSLNLENLAERREAFWLLNPAGTLPVLMLDSVYPVPHAYAIMDYLDEGVKTTQKLFPLHPLARAEVRRLVCWYEENLGEKVTRPYINEMVMKRFLPSEQGGGTPDTALIRAAKAQLPLHLDMMQWMLERRNWLGGDEISFADFAAGAHLSLFDYFGDVPFDDFGFVKLWYARLKSRGSFRALLTDRVLGLNPVDHYADPDF